jgi:leader peptidase (prepilin peptidase)/N-methyltransferase
MSLGLYFGILFITLSGPVLASFFGASVMRSANLTKAKGERSMCDHCGHRLQWFELIPIFSFIVLRGKCRYCGKPIGRKLWLTEVFGLVLYGLLALSFWSFVSMQEAVNLEAVVGIIISYVFLSTLFYLAIYDLLTYSLPTNITLLLIAEAVVANGAVLISRLFSPGLFPDLHLGYIDNLLLGLVGYVLFWVIIKLTKQKAMGLGDMYLACACGLILGWPNSASWFYVMLFSATAAGLTMALLKSKVKNLLLPLVPFMTFGFVAAILWGDKIFQFLFPRI